MGNERSTSQLTGAATEPQKPALIAGGGGTSIAVYEYGDPAGPAILLVHGFSQSHLSWSNQYRAPALQKFRLVAIDLRGHGASEKPMQAQCYDDAKTWADDIDAVMKAKALRRPLVVGWSYGGFIVSDYVREYGDDNLGGIVFVGAVARMGTPDSKAHFGPGMRLLRGMLDTRLEINIASTAQFIRAAVAGPLSTETYEEVLAYNMAVSPEIRSALLARTIDVTDALAHIRVPVLIVQGEKDTVVLPAAAHFLASHIDQAKTSFYPNAAHCPFMEDPERFNRELAQMRESL